MANQIKANRRSVSGIVIHGEKRGRHLGFPTANIELPRANGLEHGVYACWVHVPDGPNAGRFKGCCSVGTRPTFGKNCANLEVFLLDFDGDLYDRIISLDLVEFIRPELRFEDVNELVRTMTEDIATARFILEPNAVPDETGD